MTVVKCVFCGVEQEDYKGVYFIKNDGSVNYYSSGKCRKNHMKLGRDRRKVKWAEAFHLQRDKRLAKEKERSEKDKAQKAEMKANKKDSKKKK